MITRIALALCAAALTVFAQVEIEVPPPPHEAGMAVAIQRGEGAVSGTFQAIAPAGGGDVMYVHSEMTPFAKAVKGAPYSADFVSEHVQTLADGNVIRNKQTGSVSRDSEGRTRRDQPIGAIGMLGAISLPQPSAHPVFINDPVAGVNYVLDPESKTAQKLPAPKLEYANVTTTGLTGGGMAGGGMTTTSGMTTAGVAGSGMATSSSMTIAGVAGPGTAVAAMPVASVTQTFVGAAHPPDVGRESLGTKMIEGVQAEGTRTVFTIAAGEIGNDRPIQTVTERWYSSQLQTVVLTKTSDPRMGESSYQLTNISLNEPAHALFEVPADYKVVEGPQPGTKMIMRKQLVEQK
jgi:hypothetical protein